MLKVSNTDISNIYHGSIAIKKAYVGSNLVWPSSPPLPYDAEIEYVQIEHSNRVVQLQFPTYITDMLTDKTRETVIFSATAECSRVGTGANINFCGYGMLLQQVGPFGPASSAITNTIYAGGSSNYGSVTCASLDDYHTISVINNLGIIEGYIDGVHTGGTTKPSTSKIQTSQFFFFRFYAQSSSTANHIIRQKRCTFDVDGQTLIDAYPVRAGDAVGWYNKIDGMFYGLSTLDYPEISAGPDKVRGEA